jgi:hypothetical protein
VTKMPWPQPGQSEHLRKPPAAALYVPCGGGRLVRGARSHDAPGGQSAAGLSGMPDAMVVLGCWDTSGVLAQ